MATAVPEVTGPPGSSATGRIGWAVVIVALTAVVAVLATFGVVEWHRVRSADALNSARAQAVQAADGIVLRLTSMTAASGDADVAALLNSATGSFRDQFSQEATSFEQVLKKSNVSSVGRVAEAGIVTSARTHAAVLVAVTATVKNSAVPAGQQRNYRMLVSVQRDGDHWLVSDLEFVP
jgi:Mce-associated membrane protein